MAKEGLSLLLPLNPRKAGMKSETAGTVVLEAKRPRGGAFPTRGLLYF